MKQYDIIAADAILATPSIIPDAGGFYGVAPLDPLLMDATLDRAGLTMDALGLGVLAFLYVGVGASLRDCIVPHLRDDSAGSRLRQSLGALLRDDLDLIVRHSAKGALRFEPASEKRLTGWMASNLQVAILRVQRSPGAERRVGGRGDEVTFQHGRRLHDAAWSRFLVRRKILDAADLAAERCELV